MNYRIFRTQTFEEQFIRLPKNEQTEIENFEKRLSENPFAGKPLGVAFFREKKLNGRRVYFLIYKSYVVVLMVAISDKKTQQATIDAIRDRFHEYYRSIKESLGEV